MSKAVEMKALRPYPKYKESGVPWLGQVPEHWHVQKMRNLAELVVSNVDKHKTPGELPVRLCNYTDVYKNDRIADDLPFMVATATMSEIARFRLHPGDVVITKDSETWNDIGVPCLVTQVSDDVICGYHLGILRPSGEFLGEYLWRALQSPPVAVQFWVHANGITRYGLSQGAIKSVQVPLPPPEEQAAIVRFLEVADRRIQKYIRAKQRLIALLNEQKQAIIQRAVTQGLSPDAPKKPSGIPWLGDVPAHWEVRRSKTLFTQSKELARPEDEQLSATQAYGVIHQADYENRIGRKVVKIAMHLEKRKHVEVDDFVISMRSFQGGLERAWASGAIRSSYVVLRPGKMVSVRYFTYLFKCQAYIRALQSTANFIRDGQDLNFDNFCGVELPLMPIEEQERIADFLEAALKGIEATISRARKEVDLLREYRTRLIADVVTGKLDVRAARVSLPMERGSQTEASSDLDAEQEELANEMEVEYA